MSGPLMKFCERVVAGDTGEAAWMKSHPGCSARAARANASRALARASVKAEVQRLREKADEKAGSAVLTLAEKRKFLARVIRLAGAEVDEAADADLINGVKFSRDGRRMLDLPCKLRALELDAKLAGEFAEDKAKAQEADALTSLMQSVAGRK